MIRSLDLRILVLSGLLAAAPVAFGQSALPAYALSYSVTTGVTSVLADSSVITLPPGEVNTTATATITVLNQGLGTGALTGASVSGAGFQVTGLPALPASIPAGQSVRFTVTFSSSQIGAAAALLRVDLAGRSVTATINATATAPNFSVFYALADGVNVTLTDGAAIRLPSVDVNGTSTVNIAIVNQGHGTASVTGVSLTGNGFRPTGLPILPATVAPDQSLRFGISFVPTQPGAFQATFRLEMTGRTITGTVQASTATSNITLSYVDPDTNNVLPLLSNETLRFPDTVAGATSTINVIATNTGAGTGSIGAISISTPFQLLNLPSLPASLGPSNQLRFAIRFSPQQRQGYVATLALTVNGQNQSINVVGVGSEAQFSYGYSAASGTVALPSGGAIALGDVVVGQSYSSTIFVTNNGNADGQVSGISVSGAGLALSDLPGVPLTLRSGASRQFTLTFAPAQPGEITGRLTIGTESFKVVGTGIGSRLTFTYSNAAAATPVADNGLVIFSPTAVGGTQRLDFSIQNTGTSPATISSINLTTPGSYFTLEQLPALPMNLAAGGSISFPVSFLPNNTGALTAGLAVNGSRFTLSGTGIPPASLPVYQFQGSSGTVQSAQQTAIGLKLSGAYPMPVQGNLTITFASSVFKDDPAIQFANGSRTIPFTIPANSLQALFNGSATTVPLQTGTTAGDIVITPSFTLQGSFDITPPAPDSFKITIPRSAPQILNAAVTARTTNGFTVVLTGYSTTRALSKLDVQITPKPGQNLSTSQLSIDVNSASTAWFQSTTSQAFGGSFLIAIPFILDGGGRGADLVQALQSVSIAATNEAGGSTPLAVSLQ